MPVFIPIRCGACPASARLHHSGGFRGGFAAEGAWPRISRGMPSAWLATVSPYTVDDFPVYDRVEQSTGARTRRFDLLGLYQGKVSMMERAPAMSQRTSDRILLSIAVLCLDYWLELSLGRGPAATSWRHVLIATKSAIIVGLSATETWEAIEAKAERMRSRRVQPGLA